LGNMEDDGGKTVDSLEGAPPVFKSLDGRRGAEFGTVTVAATCWPSSITLLLIAGAAALLFLFMNENNPMIVVCLLFLFYFIWEEERSRERVAKRFDFFL